jgi:23S rRNA pseudouridine1911/1915/1917 synthase
MQDLADNPVSHRVRVSGEGRPLLDYLLELLHKIPGDEVREAIAEGRFRIGQGPSLTADSILGAGQLLLADVPGRNPIDPFLPPPPQRLDELFRDEHLLAVCKPAGLLCHPMGTHKVAALSIAARQLQEDGEATELRPLHRLDRETSGVLLMARNHRADAAVKAQFERRSVSKSYLALVRGRMIPEECLVDAPIGADNGPIRIRMRVHAKGKSASTRLRPLQHFGDADFGEAGAGFTWVEALPLTGRTHQIRVHLAHIGHPIVGDKLYCGDGEAFLKKWRGELSQRDIDELGLPRQALHAQSLALRHPVSGEELRLTAPPAEDLLNFARRHGSQWPTTGS